MLLLSSLRCALLLRDYEDTDVELPCDVLVAMDVYMVQQADRCTGAYEYAVGEIRYPFVNDATPRHTRSVSSLLYFM